MSYPARAEGLVNSTIRLLSVISRQSFTPMQRNSTNQQGNKYFYYLRPLINLSQSTIGLGGSSILHPLFTLSWCMQFFASLSILVCPLVVVHGKMSLMCSFLLLKQSLSWDYYPPPIHMYVSLFLNLLNWLCEKTAPYKIVLFEMELFYGIETVLMLNWILWNRTVLIFNCV